jgi:hypothetical protein
MRNTLLQYGWSLNLSCESLSLPVTGYCLNWRFYQSTLFTLIVQVVLSLSLIWYEGCTVSKVLRVASVAETMKWVVENFK